MQAAEQQRKLDALASRVEVQQRQLALLFGDGADVFPTVTSTGSSLSTLASGFPFARGGRAPAAAVLGHSTGNISLPEAGTSKEALHQIVPQAQPDKRRSGPVLLGSQAGFDKHWEDYNDVFGRLSGIQAEAEAISYRQLYLAEAETTSHSQLRQNVKDDVISSADDGAYGLRESVWDAAILVGIPGSGLSKGDAIIASIALLFNATLQLGFCLFVHIGFKSEFADGNEAKAGLSQWRSQYGHHWSLAEKETGRSLVSMVCSSDKSVASSARQSQLVDNLFDYLGTSISHGNPMYSPGFVLILFAMSCWVLSIIAEIRSILHFGLSVILPANRRQTSCQSPFGNFQLDAQLRRSHRSVIFLFIVLPRLGIACLLLYFGSQFLSYTVELSEVMLNAVALLFILEIDELLYKTLITHRLQTVLSKLTSLHVEAATWRCWQIFEGPAMLVLFAAAYITMIYTGVLPMYQNVSSVYETLCGGDLSFVYSQDGVSMWPSFTTSPLFNDLTKYPPELLVENVTRLVHARAWASDGRLPLEMSEGRVFLQEGILSQVEHWDRMSATEWSAQRPCKNDDSAMVDVVLLRAAREDQIKGCMDLVDDHCLRTPPRLFCPDFCQCQNMQNFMPTPSWNGTQAQYLAAHAADTNSTRRHQRCCWQLPEGNLRQQCLQGPDNNTSSDLKWYDDLLHPLGHNHTRWWRSCSAGFASCPSSCAR